MSKKKKYAVKEETARAREAAEEIAEEITEDPAEEKEIAEDLAQAETEECPADAAEKEKDTETETETAPETEEAEEETEGAEPEKKERKLKWARQGMEKAEKKASEFEEKIKEANDKYARLFAEFDNFRKRSEKEKSQRYVFGAKDMVERILPVIDNFERGLAAVPEDKKEDSFVTGMEMTYKLLLKALEDAGVKPIEAVGKEFNPDFHNAVMHVDDPEAGENIIVEEFQKGYLYKDHVVRYSMVKVAN